MCAPLASQVLVARQPTDEPQPFALVVAGFVAATAFVSLMGALPDACAPLTHALVGRVKTVDRLGGPDPAGIIALHLLASHAGLQVTTCPRLTFSPSAARDTIVATPAPTARPSNPVLQEPTWDSDAPTRTPTDYPSEVPTLACVDLIDRCARSAFPHRIASRPPLHVGRRVKACLALPCSVYSSPFDAVI